MSVAAKLIPLRRASERRRVRIDGTLQVGLVPVDIVIKDLSMTGFGAAIDIPLDPGQHVAVGAISLPVREAEVIWCKDGRAGFRFLSPLWPSEVELAEPDRKVVPLASSGVRIARASDERFPEPQIEKWPRRSRLLLVLLVPVTLWHLIWQIFKRT